MSRRFDLIVFDWDGTLVDSADHIAQSLQLACRDLGIPQPTDGGARYVIGLGLDDAVRSIAPELPANEYSRLVERYRTHYSTGASRVATFPGVNEGLPTLKEEGYLIGIATGKSRRGLNTALDETGLGRYPDATRCADEGYAKPHPDMLRWLMTELSVGPDRTLMVGDTTHDMQMARNADVAAIAATYGAHSKAMLVTHEPLICIACFEEFLRWAIPGA